MRVTNMEGGKSLLGMKEIMEALPHRNGFLLVDRILEIVSNVRVVGCKNITCSEFWADGHFPGEPIFPGVLMIETMAQIGAFLFWSVEGKRNQSRGYLIGVDKVKFLHLVLPGDVVTVEGTLLTRVGYLATVHCIATVDGKEVAKGIISYAFKE